MDYDTVCGGEFTSPSGVVSSPYHPGSYPRSVHLKRDINFNSFTLDLNQDLTIKTVTLFHSYNHHHQHHLLHGIADIDGVFTWSPRRQGPSSPSTLRESYLLWWGMSPCCCCHCSLYFSKSTLSCEANIFIVILFCSDFDIEGPSSSSICHWDYLEFRWLDTKHQPIPCLAFVFHFHFYTFHFHFLTKKNVKKIWIPCTILSKGWWLGKCNFDGSVLWRLVSSPRHHH